MSKYETFTEEEQRLLEPYVTSTEQSVFVLKNLPEVIKGALFSRYSRSTLGLRTLLLKDFIQNRESAFDEIQGSTSRGNSKESSLAIEKAQDFYDRILDGYGDDSIGELGGAHLAIENVSVLATKTLQDARIGGSPLEKSTRYVTFAKKVNGDYLFYKDPKIMASEHREEYLSLNRFLFDTYASLIEPMMEHVQQRMPKDSSVNEAAYNRSVRAKVFDCIRGILPASTLTNMGVFGNGRFFETLISKLNRDGLTELQDIGTSSYQELSKVVPSFIRRADLEHRHYRGFDNFQSSIDGLLDDFKQEHLTGSSPQGRQAVELVGYDADAEVKLLSGLLYSQTSYPLSQLQEMIRNTSEEAKQKLLKDMASLREHRRHKLGRGLEMPYYTFDVLGDYGMYRDLQRHRILTQERQPLSPYFGYHLPEEIVDAGLRSTYDNAMMRSAETYETLVRHYPHEAQYVVPLSYNIRWFVNINLRALSWLTELRSTPQGHESYRYIAQEMYKAVQEVHPNLALLMNHVDLSAYPLGRLGAEVRQENKTQAASAAL